ncbi:MAG TPA: hypothetical protein VHU90_03155 [Galbitalea sp.]|nr:hypothetical protein [Galbitalea sp.]
MPAQRFAAPVLWALALPFLSPSIAAQAPTPPAVTFGQLPAEWAVQQNVMDPIWKSLGMQGVNYYAFGAPVAPNDFSARSDPTSHLYQAWLGAYVVVGALDSVSANDEARQREMITHLTENDQRAWLSAMGDPAPLAEVIGQLRRSQITIDGSVRPLYVGEMRSHSDLSAGSTPLAHSLGMPPTTAWQTDLVPYHDVLLHVQAAVWYDTARHVTVVVYSASSAFDTKAHVTHDNGPVLNDSLRTLMTQAHVVDRP